MLDINFFEILIFITKKKHMSQLSIAGRNLILNKIR